MSLNMQTVMSVVSKLRPPVTWFWHCERAKAVWSAMGLATMDRVPEFMDLVWYARNVKQMTDHSLASLITTTWGNLVGVQLHRLLDELRTTWRSFKQKITGSNTFGINKLQVGLFLTH